MKYIKPTPAILAITVLVAILAASIAFGGPGNPPPMPSIINPFKAVDFSQLPPHRSFKGADGADLFFREYEPSGQPARGSAVLIHGSSANSNGMHPMAQALAAAGLRVFALDVRGHGPSGVKGQIDYIGQLENDLQVFMRSVKPPAPATLIGFSSGGVSFCALRLVRTKICSKAISCSLRTSVMIRQHPRQTAAVGCRWAYRASSA